MPIIEKFKLLQLADCVSSRSPRQLPLMADCASSWSMRQLPLMAENRLIVYYINQFYSYKQRALELRKSISWIK
jgi:hypothetical protein